MNKAILIAPLILLLVAVPTTQAYVKIHVPKTLKVGSILTISGTSAPSNATRTNCQVSVNINGAGYHKANVTGTTWTFSDGPAIKAGLNKITAKFVCFSPSNAALPDFVHHHSVNVTGVP